MIVPVPLARAQKFIIGQQSNRTTTTTTTTTKNRTKRGNSDVPKFQYKVNVLFLLNLKMFL